MRYILLLVIAFNTSPSQSFQFENMTILERQTLKHILDCDDYLLEAGSNRDLGLHFIISDTISASEREIFADPTPDIIDQTEVVFPLGDGWFEIIAKRSTSANGDYRWPYFYKFHVSDTGYVGGRFREIDLYRHDKIVAAAPIEGGDYIVAYRRGDDNSRTWATRITPEGEIVWTTEILPHEIPSWYVAGILQKSNDPERFYIHGQKHIDPLNQNIHFLLFVTEIDITGEVIWSNDYYLTEPGEFELLGNGIDNMLSYADGTYAVIGRREGPSNPDRIIHFISYFHISENGELLGRIDYHKREWLGNTLSQVIDGDKLLILAHYDHAEDPAKRGMGLLYINEEGDSLDGHFFHPETTDVGMPGPMLVRPDGKVMLWLDGESQNLGVRGATDILYTFYPDGRPGGVEGGNGIPPYAFLLNPVYPNPLNSTARIKFALAEAGFVNLVIYDITGREVAAESRYYTAGRHTTSWQATGIPSGYYLLKMEANGEAETQKLLLLK